MSLYLILSVAKNRPTAKPNTRAYTTNSGNSRNSGPGRPVSASLNTSKMAKATAKSIRQTVREESGIMSLGKYTLVRMLALESMELLMSVMEEEIRVQRITPAD